jgi:DNA primase
VSDDVIEQIKARTDIVALISEHVTLKRAGAQFKGLCPFHTEKSPSFNVNPQRQFFKCFGCGAAGDVFTFLMKLEGRSFPEVKRLLAERAGVALPEEDPREEVAARQARLERERLLAVTDAAAGFYLRMLEEHPLGKIARAELAKRGVSPETARTYRLGYAPHAWDALAKFLAQKGISPRDAELAGMLLPRKQGDGHYDRFRHRLMFPISSLEGKIVAFSGRALELPPGEPRPPEPPAKYYNSPEGPLYKKGELLFGLHEARVALRREEAALLCEGNFDVVALHQAGCKNVVAPLGTAFTPMQAKLLRRYVKSVTLVFDGDAAGRKAVATAFPLLMAEQLVARVATLPPGDDPDSYLRSKGDAALKQLVSSGLPIVEHLIETAAAEAGADPASRAGAIESLGPILQQVPSPVEQQLWVERVARAFQVHDLEVVGRQLRRGLRAAAQQAPRRGVPVRGTEPSVQVPAKGPAAPLPKAELSALGALLDQTSLFRSSEAEMLSELLTTDDLRAILQTATRMLEFGGSVDALSLRDAVEPGPLRTWVEDRLVKPEHETLEAAEAHLSMMIPLLEREQIQRRLAQMKQKIAEARRLGRHDEADEMTRAHDELFRRAGRRKGQG